MKNICVLYYDEFYEAEIVWALGNMRNENVFAVALENRVYTSAEKQRFLPDRTIIEVKPEEVDLLIIPGGNPESLYEDPTVERFVRELNNQNKYIAGICGGTFLMARYGLLDGRKCTGASQGLKPDADYFNLFSRAVVINEGVVVDKNTITATAQSFIELSIELGKLMGIYSSNEEAVADYKWLKNSKD
ncbi:MAG TPA: DJ-1/PfpI family protein [Candidatus Nitrosocosmicus sp.]|nr:DJ-1/PfpI family protein [Candidatus Nitrosocosmicus sp.]